MSQLTLSWQEQGTVRSQSFDLAHLNSKSPGGIRLGRDQQQCDLVLNDPSVSRLHAEVSWNETDQQFYIRNLRNINPIAVDGQVITQGIQPIRHGTMIVLGETTLQVTQVESAPTLTVKSLPLQRPLSSITLSHYLPIAGTGRELRQQGYLLPGIITVIWVVLLFASLGHPVFNLLLAGYLGIAGFYLIYQLCQKQKPIWVLLIPVIATPILLVSPVWSAISIVFRFLLPGRIPQQETDFLSLLIAFFFGAGLAEELLKALPVFGLAWYGRSFAPALQQKLGVTEPLDGIILGAASGLGFTLIETLGQYIPNLVSMISRQTDVGTAELLGLQLLIPRIVGSVFGHMAYSGCFGYYIGLSELKPRRRWRLLATGYLISAATHAFWNASSALGIWALGLAGILAYCLLTGAILKARQLSPTMNPSA